jgi:hypothetical protein
MMTITAVPNNVRHTYRPQYLRSCCHLGPLEDGVAVEQGCVGLFGVGGGDSLGFTILVGGHSASSVEQRTMGDGKGKRKGWRRSVGR